MDGSAIPYKFAEPWGAAAAAGYITSPIPDTVSSGTLASQHLGFPPATATPTGAGGVPPGISDFNGVFQYLSVWARWLQAGAPIPYDATLATNIGGYPKGSEVASATFPLTWLSVTDNNTSNPDAGGANWVTTQSLAFPTGLGTVTTNTTMTGIANGGRSYNVGGTSVAITLNAATFYSGQTIGFAASSACTISTSSGGFYVGGVSGSSISMPASWWIVLQWDGVNWRQIAGSFMPAGSAASNIGNLGGVLTGTLPNPGMASGAAVANIGFTPVQQGGGAGQLTSKVYLGFDGAAPRIQIDATDFGHIGMLPAANTWTGVNTFNQAIYPTLGIQIGPASNPILATQNGFQSLGDGSTQIYNNSVTPLGIGNGFIGALVNFYSGATPLGSIGNTGSAVAYNTTSDYRLKITYGPAQVGSIIDAVPVHDAAFIAGGARRPMFLAHELAAQVPSAVTGEKDGVDQAGAMIIQQVDHSALVPILWAELRDLRARLARLEAGR